MDNTLKTIENAVEKHIRGEISIPLLHACWNGKGMHPIESAYEAIIEKVAYRQLLDFLSVSTIIGAYATGLCIVLGFALFPPLQVVGYTMGVGTIVSFYLQGHMWRKQKRETTYSLRARDFIRDYDRFLWATSSVEDTRFVKLKYEQLQERAHAALAVYALSVRRTEIAWEGIDPHHWQDHKKDVAALFESLYRLMQKLKFVGKEGYKPYYERAEALLKARAS